MHETQYYNRTRTAELTLCHIFAPQNDIVAIWRVVQISTANTIKSVKFLCNKCERVKCVFDTNRLTNHVCGCDFGRVSEREHELIKNLKA